MPRFLNDRSTTLAASASQPLRIWGSASRIVTSVPRSPIIDANSQPIAPPPMTTADPGSFGIERTSSEVMTTEPSTSKPGIERVTEPAARTTALPCRVRSPDSPPLTVTVRSAPSEPLPLYTVTSRCLSRPERPPTSWSMIDCLRARVVPHSMVGAEAWTPKSAAWPTVRNTWAVSRSSLAGMHPTFKQVPPRARYSISPMSSPIPAPYRAAAYPPGPPPITMTSWCASVALTSSVEGRSYRPSRDDLIELKGGCKQDCHPAERREQQQFSGTHESRSSNRVDPGGCTQV